MNAGRAKISITAAVLLVFVAISSNGFTQGADWPRELPVDSGTVVVYQPQMDDLQGDILTFRSALSYKSSDSAEPVFGAAWFKSRVEIDRETRVVSFVQLTVTDARFPEGLDGIKDEMNASIGPGLPGWDLDLSLDVLLTSLEAAEEEVLAARDLNMDPPVIHYRDRPALLVYIDGEPVERDIENSSYKAVINTPYPLIFDGKRTYYLSPARDVWYRSAKATGPFSWTDSTPPDITAMVDPGDESEEGQEPGSDEVVTKSNAPEIVVSTVPAELIVSDGKASFSPLVDDLLVLGNSESDVFMHVGSQKYFVVLSGRWYSADVLTGPWAFQSADELPEAFAEIPEDSDQAESRVYVAGTDEAREAVMDAQIPQTAAVKKGTVEHEVSYDGSPKFESIEGTSMAYAANTGSTVLRAEGQYYLIEDAVWYVSSNPEGPWQVAESRPTEVDSIPPQSPAYNVKYVYIYDSTPDVVYVGYTPGYTGSYVYHTTIVYGTGWYYRPWISPYYYYPRHATWGFHINYNPWTGWNFGLSWGWGPFRVGFYTGGYWHRRHYWAGGPGFWGPGGYRPRPVHYGSTNIHINNVNVNVRDNNLYRDKAQKAQVAQTRDFSSRGNETRDRLPADRQNTSNRSRDTVSAAELRSQSSQLGSNSRNNVYTDKSGNVYRQDGGNWQKYDNKSWRDSPSTGQAASRDSVSRSSTDLNSSKSRAGASTRQSNSYQRSGSGYNRSSSLDKQNYSRQRSTTRSNQYRSQRGSRKSGGARRKPG